MTCTLPTGDNVMPICDMCSWTGNIPLSAQRHISSAHYTGQQGTGISVFMRIIRTTISFISTARHAICHTVAHTVGEATAASHGTCTVPIPSAVQAGHMWVFVTTTEAAITEAELTPTEEGGTISGTT